MKICKHEPCEKKHDSHGYCANHARQFRRWGRIRTKEEQSAEISERNKRTKPNLGKKWSDEARKAQSERLKGRTLNTGRTHFKKGVSSWNKNTVGLMKAWNKGLSKYGELEKQSNRQQRMAFRKVRELVIARDNSECGVCQEYTDRPQVDHIKKWSDYPELRFELSNCRTLCMPCHYYITYKRKIPDGLFWGHRRQTT